MPATRLREWPRLSPQDVAAAYGRYVTARWRGDPVEVFASWLEAHWTTHPLAEPEGGPAAISDLGSAAHRVHWHDCHGAILGYVAGRTRGHYWIPAHATLPSLCANPTEPPRLGASERLWRPVPNPTSAG